MEPEENGAMEQNEQMNGPCRHDWTYYVNVETRAIGVKRCNNCGEREEVAARQEAKKAETLRPSA